MEEISATNSESKGRYARVAAFAVLGVLAVLIVGVSLYQLFLLYQPTILQVNNNVGDMIASGTTFTLPASSPLRLRIPTLNIDTSFSEPLGLDEQKRVEIPKDYDTVGWYKYGPKPGSLGPAVVLGHVDSYEGPAIFFYLGQLVVGDSIYVDREDGTTAEFLVTASQRVSQDTFPTQDVYGNIDHAGLRLVTCTGTYNRGKLRYSHNLIVYAALKEPKEESREVE